MIWIGHNAGRSVENHQTFRRNFSLPYIRSKNDPNKKPANAVYHLLRAGFLFGLFLDPEDEIDMIVRNVSWF
jgi:hypothetical protein